jgi:hypothetical protein
LGCGSGSSSTFWFLQLPCVSEVVTFAPFCVVIVHVPGSWAPSGSPGPLCSGGGLGFAGAANAGPAKPAIAIVATNKAAVTNKLMRLITLYPFLTTSTNGLALKPSQVGCVFAGAGRVVCAFLEQNKRPALCLWDSS